jgi:hypothetical protein
MMKSHSRCTFSAQRRRQPPEAVLIGVTISLSLLVHIVQAQSPAIEGSWNTLPYEMPFNPAHSGVLHSGKVLIVDRPEGIGNVPSSAAVWDPQSGTIIV